MKTEIREYLSNFKNILILLILSNLLFLVIYRVFLHSFLIHIISGKEDIVDIEYYTGIFNNLEYAIVIVTVLIALILLRYQKIAQYFIKTLSNKNLLVFCIISSVAIQLLLLIFITPQPIADSKHYLDQANLLFENGTYVNAKGNLTAFWPVGLPAYLAFLKLFSSNFILTAKFLNILTSVGLIVFCYFIFKNFLALPALNIFLIIFTFFPNNLLSSNIILTEYPFTFFLWGSVFLMFTIQNKSSILSAFLIGIFCALGSYLRPMGIVLPFIIAGILLLKNYPAGRMNSLIILVVFISIMLPWSIRNFNLFHTLVPVSTHGGYNFLEGNHKNSNGGVNFDFEYNILNPNEAEESRIAFNRTFNDILDNPVKSLIRLPKKILYTYYRGDSSITWGFKIVEENIPPVIISLIFYITNLLFYLILFLNIYIIFSFRKKIIIKKYTELIIISAYVILVIIIFYGSERYHIPLLPIHVFLAAKYFEAR